MKKGTDIIWILLAMAAVALAAMGIGEKETAEAVDALGREIIGRLP